MSSGVMFWLYRKDQAQVGAGYDGKKGDRNTFLKMLFARINSGTARIDNLSTCRMDEKAMLDKNSRLGTIRGW